MGNRSSSGKEQHLFLRVKKANAPRQTEAGCQSNPDDRSTLSQTRSLLDTPPRIPSLWLGNDDINELKMVSSSASDKLFYRREKIWYQLCIIKG